MTMPDPTRRAAEAERLADIRTRHNETIPACPGPDGCDKRFLLDRLAAVEARTWAAAAERARTFFAPCDEAADISARECGEMIADALADRACASEAAG